jgi:hypothetical protein
MESKMTRLKDLMPDRKGDNETIKLLAKKHGTDEINIRKQLKMGIEIEMEHSNDRKKSKEIATDHIWENLNYYTKLKKTGLADELDESRVGDVYIEIGEIIERMEIDCEKLNSIFNKMFSDKNGIVNHFKSEVMHLMDIEQGIKGLKKDLVQSYNFKKK